MARVGIGYMSETDTFPFTKYQRIKFWSDRKGMVENELIFRYVSVHWICTITKQHFITFHYINVLKP